MVGQNPKWYYLHSIILFRPWLTQKWACMKSQKKYTVIFTTVEEILPYISCPEFKKKKENKKEKQIERPHFCCWTWKSQDETLCAVGAILLRCGARWMWKSACFGWKERMKVPVLTKTLIINKKVNILLLAVKGISAGPVTKMRFKPKPDWPLDAWN